MFPLFFLLSCASLFGAEGTIHVVTAAKTNAQAATITIKDFYTRDGHTNLVRHTKTKAGVVQIRIHHFYHGGSLVGDYVAIADSSGLSTEAAIPYSVSLECGASGKPKSFVIGTKDGIILDVFNYTNGLFAPVDSSLIVKANTIGSKVRGVIEELGTSKKN